MLSVDFILDRIKGQTNRFEGLDNEPRICFNKSDLEKEARHRRGNCMMCKAVPVYEVLWAEGMGHAWFCKNHLKSWATKGDGKGEICSIKEIIDGKAGAKWKDNTNPNLINKLKEIIKEEDFEKAVKTEDGIKYSARYYLVVPDLDKPSDWKLRIAEDVDGKIMVTRAQLGRVAAAMGPGFRGQKVILTSAQRASAMTRLKELYKKLGVGEEDFPPVFKEDDSDLLFKGIEGRTISIFDISKKEDEHLIMGIVYEPGTARHLDTDGDYTDKHEILAACYDYMEHCKKFRLMHKFEFTKQIVILENVIAPVDFTINGNQIKKGTWYMVLRVNDSKVWSRIKSGEITGLSMAGEAMMVT